MPSSRGSRPTSWRCSPTACRAPEAAILAALTDRHAKDDVRRTLMRLVVTEQLVETGGKYTLPAPGTEQG
jgi:hypothetical protein